MRKIDRVIRQAYRVGAAPLSPDAIEAVPIRRLTEHEAIEATAVFAQLMKQEDPYALTRTIEHVLKMRAQPSEPSAAAIKAIKAVPHPEAGMGCHGIVSLRKEEDYAIACVRAAYAVDAVSPRREDVK